MTVLEAKSPDTAEPVVELSGVDVAFSEVSILRDFDLAVSNGEFVALLGPSGTGKSTILNVIAGFVPVHRGRVRLKGVEMTYAPPNRRDLGFIFQEYALFPHMTVGENVRFPLDMRGVKRRQAESDVAAALRVVGLEGMAARKPAELSGGQRQRVAIARTIVFRPNVLLMDEPLSSLDRQLRDEMTVETRRLQRELGATVIYVTHDQTEALSLSDRVGILRNGKIEQIDSPGKVHDDPVSVHAARLCGPLNTAAPEISAAGDVALCGVPVKFADRYRAGNAPQRVLAVRPYLLNLTTSDPEPGLNRVPVTVVAQSLVGNGLRYDVTLADGTSWHVLAGRPFEGIEPGRDVFAIWDAEATLLIEN